MVATWPVATTASHNGWASNPPDESRVAALFVPFRGASRHVQVRKHGLALVGTFRTVPWRVAPRAGTKTGFGVDPDYDPCVGETLGVMDTQLLEHARAAKGFMPDDEGLALHDAGLDAALVAHGPLLEIGTYCGKSAVYLGAAARAASTVLFTVDHHRGSLENQSGWEHHDTEVVEPATGRMDTLPFFRRTIESAGLEDAVVAVVGYSLTVASSWATPVAFLFIDGGHALEVAMADYEQWAVHVKPGGTLAIHDVFESEEDGGQAPFQVWQRAVADGFEPIATTGSLRTLRRS